MCQVKLRKTTNHGFGNQEGEGGEMIDPKNQNDNLPSDARNITRSGGDTEANKTLARVTQWMKPAESSRRSLGLNRKR